MCGMHKYVGGAAIVLAACAASPEQAFLGHYFGMQQCVTVIAEGGNTFTTNSEMRLFIDQDLETGEVFISSLCHVPLSIRSDESALIVPTSCGAVLDDGTPV